MNTNTNTSTLDLSALGLAPVDPTRPCACGWTVVLPGKANLKGRPKSHREVADYDEQTDLTFVELSCEARTKGTFAPGHDARLKGLAQTAALLGGDLARDGLTVDPWTLVGELAPALRRFLPTKEQAVAYREALAAPKPKPARRVKGKTPAQVEADAQAQIDAAVAAAPKPTRVRKPRVKATVSA